MINYEYICFIILLQILIGIIYLFVKNIFKYIQIFLWANQFLVFTSWYLSLLEFKQTSNGEIYLWSYFSMSFHEVTKILEYEFMNRTFLTKRLLVSLVIFTKKAQNKGMFLDIPFIYFSKKNFMQPYFKNNKNWDLTFLKRNFKWIYSRIQHFEWTSENLNIQISKYLNTYLLFIEMEFFNML